MTALHEGATTNRERRFYTADTERIADDVVVLLFFCERLVIRSDCINCAVLQSFDESCHMLGGSKWRIDFETRIECAENFIGQDEMMRSHVTGHIHPALLRLPATPVQVAAAFASGISRTSLFHSPFVIMILHDFIRHLDTIISRKFGVLSETYIHDCVSDLAHEIDDELRDFFSVRYVLLDPETGQLESRRFYESYSEAENAAKQRCYGRPDIALLLN